MNQTIKNLCIFAAGTAVGGLVVHKIMLDKMEEEIHKQVEDVRAAIHKAYDIRTDETTPDEEVMRPPYSPETKHGDMSMDVNSMHPKPDIEEMVQMAKDKGYVDYSSYSKEPEEDTEEEHVDGDIYVIPPENFDFNDDYDTVSYTYYEDGVVADELDEPVGDVADKIGKDFMDHFGEYDDDAVYIRNDRLKTDYEILYDGRQFKEIYPKHM